MASTGQRCPLCHESLLKFLFNPNGDYILNCSSRVCLYGVLHARVFRSDQQPPQSVEVASIIDGTPETCDVVVPVGSSFCDSDGGSAANGVSNQVDLFSTFGEMDDKSTIGVIDMTTSTGSPSAFPESFDFSTDSRVDDDDMLNQWVRELTEQPSSAIVPSPMEQSMPHFPPASPVEPVVDVKPQLPPVTRIPPAESKAQTVRATKRVPKPSVRLGAFPLSAAARKSNPDVKAQPEKLVVKSIKREASAVNRATKLATRVPKSQAIASMLKSHMGATDDVPSEASSDSGIQSDASSDRSNSSSSLTPIQRLLHIEEAKKRSWGVTGMPGFKPSAATKDRQRKRPALC